MRTWMMRAAVGLATTLALALGEGHVERLSAQVLAIPFGAPGDLPVVGRWTGDFTTYIGVYRPSTNTFFLRTQNAPGPPDLIIPFGASGDLPVVGHWCATIGQADKPGVYRPSARSFLFRCTNEPGASVFSFPLGDTGDVPVAGDWDASLQSSIGVYRPSNNTFFLVSDNESTVTTATQFGAPGDVPAIRQFFLAGAFIGVYRPSTSTFFLGSGNATPGSLTVIPFGAVNDIPLIGDWTGDGIPKVGVYRPSDNTFYLKTTFP